MRLVLTAAAISMLLSAPALADTRLACSQFAPLLEAMIQTYTGLSANAGSVPVADGDYQKLLPPDALASLQAAQEAGKKLSTDIDAMVAHLQDAAYAMQKCAR